jgi:hypothetical protein
LIVILVLALSWQAWMLHDRWRCSIRLTLPDGSPAANASVAIWISGDDLPINYQGGGSWWFGMSRKSELPAHADGSGIYRLPRSRVRDSAGLYLAASSWRDGRRYEAWTRLKSAKAARWPVRLVLNPAR